jgi:hypothetical protein
MQTGYNRFSKAVVNQGKCEIISILQNLTAFVAFVRIKSVS